MSGFLLMEREAYAIVLGDLERQRANVQRTIEAIERCVAMGLVSVVPLDSPSERLSDGR